MSIEITTKRNYIEDIMTVLEDELLKLQATCPHDAIEYRYCGNSGNYDPSADSYWVEVKCLDCGKDWHEEDQYTFNQWKRNNPDKKYTELPGKSY